MYLRGYHHSSLQSNQGIFIDFLETRTVSSIYVSEMLNLSRSRPHVFFWKDGTAVSVLKKLVLGVMNSDDHDLQTKSDVAEILANLAKLKQKRMILLEILQQISDSFDKIVR